ncbi:LytR/AlgR family response regulator transcription factor [Pedobacter cryoconitis]|uniref:LytTR family two component transcriptional regulator n=1 Tax=Pedobacter cryoconitis TaxID=188932 RepID=A0A327SJC7_9SPHI|nr:LytTR family DNA-binding domain-containing protein [Pedobacter cryoconitis]RAJ28828.1 LytTR family two component transcriptional regulator [Pedobacter cryoconitis]
MMRILIIEDEARIAKRIERMTRNHFEQNIAAIAICDSLQKGLVYIANHPIDILLLDLNLNGENGFDILESMVAGSFHTIIVSAYTDKAIDAFTYGVLDFVPKPFDQARLSMAFRRITNSGKTTESTMKYLAVKKAGITRLIAIKDVLYIKGAGIYSELYLQDGKQELHDKSMEMLEQLLPGSFERIHKSYLISLDQAEKIIIRPGSSYSLLLKNGEILPIGRSRYKELKRKMI